MITTKRLKLVPIGLEHSEDLFELWSDFEAIKYTYSKVANTYEECNKKINFFMEKNCEDETVKNFTILYNDKAIGICGFPTVDFQKGEHGFYYQFNKKNWGKGFGYEAAEALLHYVATNTNATCICAEAVPANPASVSILRSLGFKETHIEKNGFTRNEMELDLIHFKLLNPTK